MRMPTPSTKQAGFKDHKEMAEYMKNKGYEWNAYKNNYLKAVGKVEEEEADPPEAKQTREDLPDDIAEYLPFIRFLYEKRDDIYHLLTGVKEDGKIPRYAVTGIVRTKAESRLFFRKSLTLDNHYCIFISSNNY